MQLMPDYRFTVKFEQDEDGVWIADCPDLYGAHAHGTSIDAAKRAIREVIELHLETIIERGDPVPQPHVEILDFAM